MGYLNMEEETFHRRKITAALRRRGLEPALDEEWIIHGPHEDMNYQVYIGYAQVSHDEEILVAIYPRAVYEIEDESRWAEVQPDQKIPIEQSEGIQ